MKTNREIDALVAEKIFGLTKAQHAGAKDPFKYPYNRISLENHIGWFKDGEQVYAQEKTGFINPAWSDTELPHYSTDIAASWEVVEKFTDVEMESWKTKSGRNNICVITVNDTEYRSGIHSTMPLAISNAALKALEEV